MSRRSQTQSAVRSARRLFFVRTGAILAVVSILPGCATPPRLAPSGPPRPEAVANALSPSSNRLIGRVLTVDGPRLLAIVDLSPFAGARPPAGARLTTRGENLEVTGELQAGPYQQGRTLGAVIVGGRPQVDDEVVWTASPSMGTQQPLYPLPAQTD